MRIIFAWAFLVTQIVAQAAQAGPPLPTPTPSPTACPTGTPPRCVIGEYLNCDVDRCIFNGCRCDDCTVGCPNGQAYLFAGSCGCVCAGDCDGGGAVTVDELISAVSIALGGSPPEECPAVDASHDAAVTVDELTGAVVHALEGCPEGPTNDVFDGFRPEDVNYLASDELDGRNNGTPGSQVAQAYLIQQLRGMGAVGADSSKTGDDAFKQPFTVGTNIVGILRGGELPDEYVVIGAHYDHFSGCNGVCNGATDNASGAAAVLAIGREIADNPQPPRRSIVLAFWDAEEDGLVGSAHYTANPLVPLVHTVAYVNFDIQGANLLPSLRDFSFAVGAETGGARLQTLVNEAIGGVGLGTRQLSAIFGQGRSDYLNFIIAQVPTVFFSDSTGPCYHTREDDPEIVDFGKLAKQSEIGTRLAEALAETTNTPSFASAPIPFADAVVVRDIISAGMADLGRFGAMEQTFLLAFNDQLQTIVGQGPENFDDTDVAQLGAGVLQVIDILTRQPCDGFLGVDSSPRPVAFTGARH